MTLGAKAGNFPGGTSGIHEGLGRYPRLPKNMYKCHPGGDEVPKSILGRSKPNFLLLLLGPGGFPYPSAVCIELVSIPWKSNYHFFVVRVYHHPNGTTIFSKMVVDNQGMSEYLSGTKKVLIQKWGIHHSQWLNRESHWWTEDLNKKRAN